MRKIRSILQPNFRLINLVPYFIFAFIFIVLPILFLTVKAFDFESLSESWNISTSSSIMKILGRSVYIGLATAAFSLIIALPFVYIVSKLKSKWAKYWLIFLILSPLALFTIFKIFALRGLLTYTFNENGLNNEFIIIIGLIYLNLPFIIIPLYSVMNNMPKSLKESSYDLGYNFLRTFVKVIIPYSLKAILAGVSLVFILSSTSIAVSEKLIPSSSQFQLIANTIDSHAFATNSFELSIAAIISLIMVCTISSIYALIYAIPLLIRKFKGGY